MVELIKKFDTGTNFEICIFLSQRHNKFATSTHDSITKKHDEIKWYDFYDDAMKDAKNRVKQFKINENQTCKLTENDLFSIIKESVKQVLNEIGDTPKGRYRKGRVMGRQIKDKKNINDNEIVSNMNTTAFRAGFLDELNNTNVFDQYLKKYKRQEKERRKK